MERGFGPRERRERFPKGERLQGRDAFQRIYAQGDVHRGRLMTLIRLREADRKVGFVASRKVGGAVQRNRARRVLRESYRRLRSMTVGGAHLIFVARRELASAPYQDVYDEMRQLLDAAGLYSRTE